MQQLRYRMLIMAGGTGGHVFPALAVAQYLQTQNFDITWLGTKRGLEFKVVPEHGIPLDTIDIQALRGKSKLSLLFAPFKLIKATWQAMRIIQKRKPDVVLGMGGFASGPGGLASWLMRKPLVVHEQNAVPGMTNRVLAKFARAVCESFPDTFALPHKYYTGNPVREDIAALPEPRTRYADRAGPIRVLVLGGSLGATALNELLPKALATIPEAKRPEIWHQCGQRHFDVATENYKALNLDVKLTPFIDNMAQAYAWADLVICRSGALTITELVAAGLPAILIPYPYAVDDHQTKNGQIMVNAGAAVMMQQRDVDADKLANMILQLAEDRSVLAAKAQQARSLMRPNATQAVAKHCMEAMGATL